MAERKKNNEIAIKSPNLVGLEALDMINNMDIITNIVNSKLVLPAYTEDDVVAALLMGKEFDLNPMQSIMMMGKLNMANAPIIMKGMSLGMTLNESLDSIYAIPGEGGINITIGGNAAIGVLRRNNIELRIIDDFIPIMGYKILNGENKDQILKLEDYGDRIMELTALTTQKDIDEAKTKNPDILFCTKVEIDRLTTIEFKRGKQVHIERYYLSRAENAGITKTKKGGIKKNWKDPHTMCRHRCIGNGARFIAADILGQTYLSGEAQDVTDRVLEIDDADVIE